MTKKKLSLKRLHVNSFITRLDAERQSRIGGNDDNDIDTHTMTDRTWLDGSCPLTCVTVGSFC